MKTLMKSILKQYHRHIGFHPITIRKQYFRCDPDHLDFWRGVSKNCWEPQTFKVLTQYLKRDSIYYDLGAWIGPTVLYAARLCKDVICFEPDFVAYEYLLQNIRLNKLTNILPFNLAVGSRDGIEKMESFHDKLGDSTTSLLANGGKEYLSAFCINWRTFRHYFKERRIDFIKIDIEGGEFAILSDLEPDLRRYKPVTFISIHAPFLPMDQRRNKLERMKNIMDVYKKCYDETLHQVDHETITNEESIERNRTFLFTE